ncbi:MAG TPA: PaaX family transcriptional regulator C-terminal domain-containing protein [Streptosporangiaceae bacterium]|nr:PaaX family transcriptional regulator C-terminal domain-containing protein [Streptosporangiaceae bacterium]
MSTGPPSAAGEPGHVPRPVTRRHDGGSGSARSLLLTVLGEFVLPSGEPPWTSTLLHVAGGLGLEEKSVRQALARLAADGWVTAHRAGRRVRWALTQPGHELLAEGAARIYSFGRDAAAWDGRWLVLLVTVPETRRQLRHKLRTRLTWAGFGSPLPGVWVSPHPAREAEAKQVTEQLGLSAETFSFTGPFAGIGAQRSLVEQAWHLGDLAARYGGFLAAFADLRPAPGDETLSAQIRLVHEWRRFPLADPGLPRELLPPGWIGARAAAVFTGQHRAWEPAARARWQELGAPVE